MSASRSQVSWWEQEWEARAEDARYLLGDEVECDDAAERARPGGDW